MPPGSPSGDATTFGESQHADTSQSWATSACFHWPALLLDNDEIRGGRKCDRAQSVGLPRGGNWLPDSMNASRQASGGWRSRTATPRRAKRRARHVARGIWILTPTMPGTFRASWRSARRRSPCDANGPGLGTVPFPFRLSTEDVEAVDKVNQKGTVPIWFGTTPAVGRACRDHLVEGEMT